MEFAEILKETFDNLLGPISFFLVSIFGLGAIIVFRSWWTRGSVALTFLILSIVYFILSMTDSDFRAIVQKPDNIPITIMLYSIGFVLWLSFRKMVVNDNLIAAGKPTGKPVAAVVAVIFELGPQRARTLVPIWPFLPGFLRE